MNKWIGMGRLTTDPEARYSNTANGQLAIARYRIAIDRYKNDGADFINCVAMGKAGEFAEKYLRKGMKILVTGRIQTGSYDNKEGQKVYTTDVIVESQEFCESKRSDAPASAPAPSNIPTDDDGFMNIPDGIDEELPFN